jgi:hypothetical protein
MRRMIAALTAIIATATTVFVVGPVSTASADSWNHTWSYLHYPSQTDDNQCLERTIRFARGLYRWRLFMAHWAHTDNPRVKVRRLRLSGGTYLWQECVRATTGRFYEHSSGLWRGSGYASLESVQAPGYGDGQHHWGSTLRRIGP